jgi:hypothetical protein
MMKVFFQLNDELIVDHSWFRNPPMLPSVGHKILVVPQGLNAGQSFQVTDIFWTGPDLVTIHIKKY